MNTTSPNASHTPITLLTLPLETKKEIFDYLVHDDLPTLAILRRTHTSFLAMIPKSDLRTKPTKRELRHQLVIADNDFEYLLPVDQAPCYVCTSVGPREGVDRYVLGNKIRVYECPRCMREFAGCEDAIGPRGEDWRLSFLFEG